MLIPDTGPLVAMPNAKDKHHKACIALFRRFHGPIIVPAPNRHRGRLVPPDPAGSCRRGAFLGALARGELIVEATTAQDFARMADLVRQYADFPLGTADASVIAAATLPEDGTEPPGWQRFLLVRRSLSRIPETRT